MRKIISIALNNEKIFALTDDGIIFSKRVNINDSWQEEEGIDEYVKIEDSKPAIMETVKVTKEEKTVDVITPK